MTNKLGQSLRLNLCELRPYGKVAQPSPYPVPLITEGDRLAYCTAIGPLNLIYNAGIEARNGLADYLVLEYTLKGIPENS